MSETAARTGFHAPSERHELALLDDVAELVHKINNPLFAILGHVEFALREAEPGSVAEERMQIIQRTGLEIKDILHALVAEARQKDAKD